MRWWRISIISLLTLNFLCVIFLIYMNLKGPSIREILIRAGASLEANSFYNESSELYARAFFENPQNGELLLKAGELSLKGGNCREALKYLEMAKLVKLNEKNRGKINSMIAECLEKEGKSAQAQYFIDREIAPGKKNLNEKIVAEIGGKIISENEVRDSINSLPPEQRKWALENLRDYTKSFIAKEVIYQKAVREGLLNSPSLQKILEEFKKNIVLNEYLKKLGSSVNPHEDDLKNFYLAHPENYSAFLLVKGKYLKASPESAPALFKDMDKVKFDEIFSSQSEKMKGKFELKEGKFREDEFLSCGEMVKKFLFRTPEGEVSPPLPCGNNIFIFKIERKEKKFSLPYESVREEVLADYMRERTEKLLEEILEKEVKEGRVRLYGVEGK